MDVEGRAEDDVDILGLCFFRQVVSDRGCIGIIPSRSDTQGARVGV